MATKATTQTPEAPAAVPPVDGSTPITLTFDQLKELLAGSGGGGAAVAALTAQLDNGVLRQNPDPPLISALNPEGERDHPRPALVGTVYLLNTRLQAEELTREEIELLNALTPGYYGEFGEWVVENMSPGMGRPQDRKIQITFPNKDKDQRDTLPSHTRTGPAGTGLVEMLRTMVHQSSALTLA